MDPPTDHARPRNSLTDAHQARLRELPSMTELTVTPEAQDWLEHEPRGVVIAALRRALDEVRGEILAVQEPALTETKPSAARIIERANRLLQQALAPQIQPVINATGIILHTGLGRAVFSSEVIDAAVPALKGYVNVAINRATGRRIERDELVEPLLTELTGAEAATVVNNNAAGTLLVLAALAADREVIVSRGQLIEIGGSFRLPDVMALSRAKLVEVGTTNRTHLKDYGSAITDQTAALMRVHPSNYRVVGFIKAVGLDEMVELAHSRGLIVIDDLGAGALIDLRQFGLPAEPLVKESISAGADIVLFSGDKLIGGSQGGIIVGKKELIAKIRKHPFMRAARVDKTCILFLERTLAMFRDPDRLRRENPTYVMMTTSIEAVRKRAEALAQAIRQAVPHAQINIVDACAYLGSGSLPEHALPSSGVSLVIPDLSTERLAERLRLDPASVFSRIENDQLFLDARTITDGQLPQIAAALTRVTSTLDDRETV